MNSILGGIYFHDPIWVQMLLIKLQEINSYQGWEFSYHDQIQLFFFPVIKTTTIEILSSSYHNKLRSTNHASFADQLFVGQSFIFLRLLKILSRDLLTSKHFVFPKTIDQNGWNVLRFKWFVTCYIVRQTICIIHIYVMRKPSEVIRSCFRKSNDPLRLLEYCEAYKASYCQSYFIFKSYVPTGTERPLCQTTLCQTGYNHLVKYRILH